jgi:hypothetical protein
MAGRPPEWSWDTGDQSALPCDRIRGRKLARGKVRLMVPPLASMWPASLAAAAGRNPGGAPQVRQEFPRDKPPLACGKGKTQTWVVPLSWGMARSGKGCLFPVPRGCPSIGRWNHTSVLAPANSAKQSARLLRPGGMSRGQNHRPLRLRRSQRRVTSTSRTTVVSTRPPCRLMVCRIAQVDRDGLPSQTTGSLPCDLLVGRPARRMPAWLRAGVAC